MSDELGMIEEDGTYKSLTRDIVETLETVLKPQSEPS
jgi:hypothetical protein